MDVYASPEARFDGLCFCKAVCLFVYRMAHFNRKSQVLCGVVHHKTHRDNLRENLFFFVSLFLRENNSCKKIFLAKRLDLCARIGQ